MFVSQMYDLKLFIIWAAVIVAALVLHEISHAFTAYLLGDYTAKLNGRLSLNPLKHLDPIGTICLLLFGFGWAKPVPVRVLYFKNPKRDMAIVAIMGPVSNFLMAFIGAILLGLSCAIFSSGFVLSIFFDFFIQVNILLGIFNLIPLPPLDGSRVLMYFLPAKTYMKVAQYERYTFIGLIVLSYLGILMPVIDFFRVPLVKFFFSIGQAVFNIIS